MNSFNLYEDILSRTWNRYYYEVEAETLEEAIEKVKDGEVDCYDSEQLYESTDDLAPEENNGSATREIYHEDEVVWDNAKLVNRGEIITQDLRNISDQLFHIMESEPEEFSAGCISLALVKEVLEKLGWTEDLETNGWDIDYWVTFIKEEKDVLMALKDGEEKYTSKDLGKS